MKTFTTPTALGYALALLLSTALPAASAEMKPDQRPRRTLNNLDVRSHRHRDASGRKLPYRLLIPPGYDGSTQQHPMLVFLHGAGERGGNNRAQLTHGKRFFCAAAVDYGCFVLAPQCPCGGWWAGRHWADPQRSLSPEPSETMQLVFDLIARLRVDYRIDAQRVYLMGLSMGGFGVWDAVQRQPDMFAAAVPICGGGDPSQVAHIAQLPVWVFHGQQDPVVSVELSRNMVGALQAAGGEPRYTEYAGVGHNSWDGAFNEPELLSWLTAQRRSSAE
ncbi:MAG: prolyl oligopeptidase family serine peptidase [Pirellulaceae bacterium]|nr:prolyl oligopeptidase family serine peptidase [Pirellulaceae bacterium]